MPDASIPDGLSFTPADRVLAGTPTAATIAAATLTYTVTDSTSPIPATVALAFTVTVNAVVPAAPTDITLVPKDTRIVVSWTAVPDANNGGATITGYTATATDTPNAATTFTCTATGAAATTCDSPITGLTNGDEYSVTVVATNSVGDSAPSAAETVTPGAPPAPTNITLDPGTIEIIVSWIPIPEDDSGGAPILWYTAIATADDQTEKSCAAFGPRATTCTITGLISGVRYEVTVRAVNRFGDGAPSTAEAVTDIETERDRLIAHTARLNNQILALAAQTVTAETMTKVAGRVNTAATPTAVYEFGGQSSLQGLFGAHGKAMLEDTMEYERLLNGASFVLPVRAADGDSDDRVGAIMVWGGSESRNLDVDEDGLDWDGDMVSAHIGMDQLIRKEVLTGVLLSWNLGRFDYRDQDATSGADQDASSGDYQYRTNHIHPYIGWLPYDGLSLWATAGYGYGEIKIDSAVDGGRYTDAIQRSLAGGMDGRILRSDGPLLGGVTTLNLKGDVARARVTVEENVDEGFMRQEVYSHRLRLLLSGEQRRESAQGRVLTPSIEVGIRYDGGDSVIGSGVEWGAGLRYATVTGALPWKAMPAP